MNDMTLAVLGWVLPIVLGPIVYIAAREVLNAHRKIDDLPAGFKRAAVVALGVLVSAVFGVLGIAPPPECATLPVEVSAECAAALNTPVVLKGVTGALVAMLLHKLKKSRPYE